MKRDSDIPHIVLEKAKEILLMDGGSIKHIGSLDGREVYYAYVDGAETGFPSVFLFDGRDVEEIYGFEALNISRPFFKD